MSEEEVILLGLIRRYDTKGTWHIGAIIATIFGSFTILTFLRGAGLIHTAFFVFIEIVFFPLSILYFLARALHYSNMVETIRKTPKFKEYSTYHRNAFNDACKALPPPLGWIINKRRNFMRLRVRRRNFVSLTMLAYAVWVMIVFMVLTLP